VTRLGGRLLVAGAARPLARGLAVETAFAS